MAPEIWCMTDRTVCNFGPFFALFLINNLKNQNFKKMKKVLGDIIILHKCTKNHDHILYCPWNIACDGCNFYLSFQAVFCIFTSLRLKKNQNVLTMKKTPWDIIILHILSLFYIILKFDHIMQGFWDMVCHRQTDGQTDRFFKDPQNIFQKMANL